jgi:short-subunit dehydrogenase
VPKSVLITGASSGIGAALAIEYAAPGRALFLQGRDAVRLAAVAAGCEARGAIVTQILQDLTPAEAWRRRLESLAAQTPIDLAILNAGVTLEAREDGEAWPAVEHLLAVNLLGGLASASALVPAMRARGGGQIALMSSLAAWYGLPRTPSYCASKAALKAYGEALRGLLAPQGIAVNVVLPGYVATPMNENDAGPRPFRMAPAAAARRIRQGLARNRARIAFPWPLSWGMWWLAVLPPGVSQRIVRALGFAERRV